MPLPSASTVRQWPFVTQATVTITFVGEVMLALGRALRGGPLARPLARDVLEQLDATGPRSLPIVLLTCGLIGMMLAYMGGAQLGRVGTQSFLADMVGISMVRELAPLMTGIILTGRIGAAFAAHLATMQAGDEIDALRVLGVQPVTHLVLPRLLALLAVGPALVVCGALVGILAGWLPAVAEYGLTSFEYFSRVQRAITSNHIWVGLFKGELYVVLVALAGCREGLTAGRSAQAVGEATTRAVVKALVWIVSAASLTTVIFSMLQI
ncbi:MAG: ABC transporter permease [Proteobacteria bacterium]|nr:ABC transporter permease [Pseudomonadota bacterium]